MFFKSKKEVREKISIDEFRNINNSIVSSLEKSNINIDYDTINNVVNKYFEMYDPLVDKCKQLQQDRYANNIQQAILEIESKLEDCFKEQDWYSYTVVIDKFGYECMNKVKEHFEKRGFCCIVNSNFNSKGERCKTLNIGIKNN